MITGVVSIEGRQDSNWTVISNGRIHTLFWPIYMDRPFITTDYYQQTPWYFNGKRATRLDYTPYPNTITGDEIPGKLPPYRKRITK